VLSILRRVLLWCLDHLDDGSSIGERWTAPAIGDVTEHPVLDLLPFRFTLRIVSDLDRQPGLVGELLELDLPQAYARRSSPTVGGDCPCAFGYRPIRACCRAKGTGVARCVKHAERQARQGARTESCIPIPPLRSTCGPALFPLRQ
jgi:hypothetical protein